MMFHGLEHHAMVWLCPSVAWRTLLRFGRALVWLCIGVQWNKVPCCGVLCNDMVVPGPSVVFFVMAWLVVLWSAMVCNAMQ